MAANNWRPAGVNNNYNNALNWSLLAVPTASDGNTATFDNNVLSGPCTVNVASVANAIDFNTYNNTITMTNTLTISGNVTLGSGMTIAGAAAMLLNATATLTSNGKTWSNAFQLNGTTITYTLADDWTIGGLFTFGAAGVVTTLNGNNMKCNGGFTQVGTGQAGTTLVTLQGTGNWVINGGVLSVPLTINTVGTYTLSGTTLSYGAGTLTYVSGTLSGTIPTLNTFASCTLNTAGIIWNNIAFTTVGATITLNSLLTSVGTISTAVNTVFAGTNGFNTTNFTCTTAGTSITFKNGLTYTINSVLTLRGTAASNITFISASAGNQYFLKLTYGGTQTVSFINTTDSNSNSGMTIFNYKGTLSNTNNWSLLTNPTTMVSSFIC